jgi:hypothetical protein
LISNRNIGTQFTTYSGQSEKLPEIMLGVSQELENVPLDGILLREFAAMESCFSNPRSQTSLNGSSQDEKCQQ